ncbi:MAG: S49 family peptidase [Desulfovibrio sp.]|nr:S49 family peptidase [Desulfovibrio sp.]
MSEQKFTMHDPLTEPCLWSSTEAGLQKHVALHANSQLGDAGKGGSLEAEGSRATLFVLGPLVRTESEAASGETSYEDIRSSLQAALDDPTVETIELFINSPGGDVSGLPELAGFIEGAARQKKMCAWIDGLGASAAYWLASATGDVRTSPSAQVGSIGVLYVHDDMTGYLKSFGIERTWMQAGKYKTAGAPKKLSAEEKAEIQARLDAVYDKFTSFVARRMGLDLSARETWADGQLFDGERARALGLVTELQPFRESAAEPHPTWGNTMDTKTTEPVGKTAEVREAEILAIAGVVLGEDAQKRLAGALGTKLTAEQLESQKAFWQVEKPAAAQKEGPKAEGAADVQKLVDDTVKAQLSPLLQSAGPVSAASVKKDEKRDLIEQIGRYGEGK